MKIRSHHPVPLCAAVLVLAGAVGVVCTTIALGACGAKGCGGPTTPTASPSTAVTSPATTPSPPSPSGSAASPSPVTRQLVIAAASGVKGNGLSVISSTGHVRQLLAPGGGPLRNLAWSPDGARLAYLQSRSRDDYKARLWWYDATTAETKQVVFPNEDNEAWVSGFTWVGPTELVASVLAGGPPYSPGSGPTYRANGVLWRCDVAADRQTTVRDDDGELLRGSSPSSSADGAKIAYVFYGPKSGTTGTEKLMVFDADDGKRTVVRKGEYPLDTDGDQFAYPLISSDGSMIVALETGNDPGFACRVYRLDGSIALQTGDLAWGAPGSWSSDGRLAFAGASHLDEAPWWADSIRVWQPPSATSKAILRPVTPWITSLAWSPKATQIAFSRAPYTGDPSQQGALWVVDRDGTNKHMLLAHGSWPAWAMAPVSIR